MTVATAAASPSPMPLPPSRRWKLILLKLAFSVALLLILFELACQVVLWRMQKSWHAIKSDPAHYYAASDDPILVYELKKNYDYSTEGRRVHVNQFGIRDDEESVPSAPRKIAILGDSVVFGIAQSQDQTLAAQLQQSLDPTAKETRVLSLGVPGYALREIPEYLNEKNDVYHVNEVVFVMNPNDFSWRDSVYEGADNGVYRLYRRPVLAAPFMMRKAIYRWHKQGTIPLKNEVLVSVPWYQWMYDGNRDAGYQKLRELKSYCDSNRIKLTVLPLPAACAYKNGSYALDPMYDHILSFLKSENIHAIDARKDFSVDTMKYCDNTDHLTAEGNRFTAKLIAEAIKPATTQP